MNRLLLSVLSSLLTLQGCNSGVATSYIYHKAITAYEKKGYVEAEKWMRVCADAGHVDAMTMLGSMYLNGNGVSADAEKAITHRSGTRHRQGGYRQG